MDGHDCAKVRGRVVEEHDLLVFAAELVEDAHVSVGESSKRSLSGPQNRWRAAQPANL
jgi:hypothetical protein